MKYNVFLKKKKKFLEVSTCIFCTICIFTVFSALLCFGPWNVPPSRISALWWWQGLCNSMRLWAMLYRATQDPGHSKDFWQNVIHWRKGWQNTPYTCCKNLMNCIKCQKDMTPKDESPRSEGIQYVPGKERRRITNSPWMNEAARPKWIQFSVVDVSGAQMLQRTVLHRNLECYVHESKKTGRVQTGYSKNKHQHLRN